MKAFSVSPYRHRQQPRPNSSHSKVPGFNLIPRNWIQCLGLRHQNRFERSDTTISDSSPSVCIRYAAALFHFFLRLLSISNDGASVHCARGSVDESGPCNIGPFRWKLIDCLPLPFTKFLHDDDDDHDHDHDHDDDDERGLFRNRTAVIDRMLPSYALITHLRMYVCMYVYVYVHTMTRAKFYFGVLRSKRLATRETDISQPVKSQI